MTLVASAGQGSSTPEACPSHLTLVGRDWYTSIRSIRLHDLARCDMDFARAKLDVKALTVLMYTPHKLMGCGHASRAWRRRRRGPASARQTAPPGPILCDLARHHSPPNFQLPADSTEYFERYSRVSCMTFATKAACCGIAALTNEPYAKCAELHSD